MKKRRLNFLVLGLIIVLLVLILFFTYTSPKPIEKKETRSTKTTIRIAGDNNFPPYEFIDSKGEYVGFNIDIMHAIGEAMDVNIELIPMRWADAVSALKMGKVDAIQGMSKTLSREDFFQFTQATSIHGSSIFIKKETDYIRSIEDLQGVRIAYQKEDVNEKMILDIPYAIPVIRNNQIEALKALLDNEADAFIGNREMAIFQLHKMKAANKVKVLEEPFTELSYGPATTLDSPYVYNILDEGLTKIKDSGIYDAIYKKWFGYRLSPSSFGLSYYLRELVFISLVILIIFLAFLLWNKRLQVEVARRTKELETANRKLREHQRKIYNLAYFDPITRLPNKLYFIEQLERTIAKLDKSQVLGVFYLDLDKFKHINNTLGHKIGDQVLKKAGERLKEIEGDTILARASGDAFLKLVKDIRTEGALDLAKRIIEEFRQPITVKKHTLYLTLSVGIALYPEGGRNSTSLIKNAKIAFYRAKDMGGNSYFKYNKDIGKQEYTNLNTLNELREAVTNNEFILYYQPKICIKSKEIVGIEALIRWHNPRRGVIFPDKFIPLAEDTGLIFPIGEWVIREACRQNKEWIDKGYKARRICVNVSPRQFQHENFLDTISKVLEETGLPPEYLGIEITESVAVSDIENTINLLKELRELGVAVVMDDFGTGYSSLSYLKEMNIDEMKIDRSFVTDIETNEKDRAISNTIILLAKQFNILVTAEGIEKEAQLKILESLGCDKAQGYYFSRPIPSLEFEKLL